jgi:NAD-dependent DNA ligase
MDLNGKKVVFTGFSDADLKEQIENAGGQVTTSVSGQTNILVVQGSKS